MALPHTAPAYLSVWKGLGRQRFEYNVTRITSSSRIHEENNWLSHPSYQQDDTDALLTVAMEEQLANDLAFVAVAQCGPKAVRAVTVQVARSRAQFSITLASNEKVPNDVQHTFQCMCDLLIQCAKRSITRKTCEEMLLEAFVQLNLEKLEARLKPRQANFPASRASACPWLLLPFEANYIGLLPKPATSLDQLRFQAKDASGALKILGEAKPGDIIETWVALIISMSKLHRSLNGIEEHSKNAKRMYPIQEQLHQISQLARYSGLSRTLSKLCRQYPQHLMTAKVIIVEPYAAVCGVRWTNMKLYVHAEISIITHHELLQTEPKPRVIGSSRSACYLCESFIRAHNQYFITSTHGTFYTRWTVPDLLEFSEDTRKRYSKALRMVNKDVLAASKISKRPLLAGGPWVNLSVVDLGRQLLSPILSSIVSLSPKSSQSLGENEESHSTALEDTPNSVLSYKSSETERTGQYSSANSLELGSTQTRNIDVSLNTSTFSPEDLSTQNNHKKRVAVQGLELFLDLDVSFNTLTQAEHVSGTVRPAWSDARAATVNADDIPTAEPGLCIPLPQDGQRILPLLVYRGTAAVEVQVHRGGSFIERRSDG